MSAGQQASLYSTTDTETDSDGTMRIYPAWETMEELIAYAKECCVLRELTDAERELFGLPVE